MIAAVFIFAAKATLLMALALGARRLLKRGAAPAPPPSS